MSRIRTLKPEWLEDEALLECSLAARVLSAGLLLVADDYGNGRAGEKILSARIFPGDPVKVLRDALAELVSIRYVVIYQSDGQTYFHIRNWSKHQRVDKPGPAKVPGPPQESSSTAREPCAKSPDGSKKDSERPAPRARPLPSSPIPSTGPSAPEGDARGRVRNRGERPRPRPDLLHAHIPIAEYVPLGQHWDYGAELGLSRDAMQRALEDLRDKHGKKTHTAPWLDERFSAFLEAAARPRRSGNGLTSRAQAQLDAQLEHIAELEAKEAFET